MSKQTFETTFAGRHLLLKLVPAVAKQANGAAVIRYGESTVLGATVMSKKCQLVTSSTSSKLRRKNVRCWEIPGGFNKREGRPTTDATLTARLIDRQFVQCLLKASVTKFK